MMKKDNLGAMENDQIVIKSNSLINARYKLEVAEMRILLFTLKQIQREDKDFKTYKIYIKDFIDDIGTKAKNEYERAKQITGKLVNRRLDIPTLNNGLVQTHWLIDAEYGGEQKKRGFVEIRIHPKLKPFLLQLKSHFTKYNIQNILHLSSTHSIRIYELLKQYENIRERTFEVKELKRLLGINDKYKSYYMFKKRVLLISQKELRESTDIYFDFQEIKQSQRIVKIKFTIKTQIPKRKRTKTLPKQPEIQAVINFSKEQQPELFKKILEFGFNDKQTENIIKQHDEKYILENLEVVKNDIKQGKVKNITAYTNYALKDDYRQKKTLFDIEKEKKQEKVNEKESLRQKQAAVGKLLKTEFDDEINQEVEKIVAGYSDKEINVLMNKINSSYYKSLFKMDKIMAYKEILHKEKKIDRSDEAFIKYAIDRNFIVEKDRLSNDWLLLEKK